MKKRILCFGDSNTWGSKPCVTAIPQRHDEEVRWTGVLARELGKGYTVIEEGQNGRTTVWDDPVEERLAGSTYLFPCVDSHAPFDLIIIMLGTNDLKLRFGGSNAQTIASGLDKLVHIVRTGHTYGATPEILIAAPTEIEPTYKNKADYLDIFGDDADQRSKGFGDAYAARAKALGCHFLDAAKYARASQADGVHMEADGHLALGKAFAEAVKRILG